MKKTFLAFLVILLLFTLPSLSQKLDAEIIPTVENPYAYDVELLFVKQSSGEGHTLGLTLDGRVYAWGWNQYGQLGNGTIISSNIAIEITEHLNLNSGEIVTDIAAGNNHSSVITSECRLLIWGYNIYGALGDGTTANKLSPIDITSQFGLDIGETIIFAANGYFHSSAITSNGRVFTWGQNYFGHLGDGTTVDKLSPIEITSQFGLLEGETVTRLSLGYGHSAAITSIGRVFTWGRNIEGQLGDGTTTDKWVPTDITANFSLEFEEEITSLEILLNFSGVLTSLGKILMWGENNLGQLGDGTYTYRLYPTDITANCNLAPEETIIDLSLGIRHAGALTSNNRVLMWGNNQYYQLGDGTNQNKNLPFDITSRFVLETGEVHERLHLGGYSTSTLTSNNRIFSWGNNNVGQLGDGTNTIKSSPVALKPLRITITRNYLPVTETIVKQSLGANHTALITSNNRVFTFGYNIYGQLGIGSSQSTSLPIEITDRFNLSTNETIIDVILSKEHSMALSSDGRIFTWGKNDYGQLGDGTTQNSLVPKDITTNFNLDIGETIIFVRAGDHYNLIITSNNRIFVWGWNQYGQLGDGTKLSRYMPVEITSQFGLNAEETIIDISLGGWHGLAYTSDNRVFSWGANWSGELGDGTTTESLTPKNISSSFGFFIGESVIGISAGSGISGLITSLGRVFFWGYNGYGSIGDGTTTNRLLPTETTGQFGFESGETPLKINIGKQTSSLISSENRIFVWGYNSLGQLGDGTTTNRSIPIDITLQFSLSEGEIIEKLVLGKESHSSAITSTGNLYMWGYGNIGQLGHAMSSTLVPFKLNKYYLIENEMLLTYLVEEQNHLFTEFQLSIFPKFEIIDEIESININGLEYTDIEVENGRIKVNLPNIWVLDDRVFLEVNSITFADSTIMNLSGKTTATFFLVEDTLSPVITFDYEYDLYLEQDTGNDSYIQATALDDAPEIIDVIITGTVDWSIPGTYDLAYTATDSSGNFSQRTRTVEIMPMISTSATVYGDFSFYFFDDETWSESINLTNQVVRYDFTNYSSITTHESYPYDLYWNYPVFEFIINDWFIVVDKGVYFEDTILPTFDPIDNQILEAGDYVDFDWTNLITNAYDNSNQFYLSEFFDGVDYNTAGVYSVAVRVTDPSGNYLQRSFDVTVYDTQAPTFDFIPDQYLEVNTLTEFDWTTIITGISDNSDDLLIIVEEFDNVIYNLTGIYSVRVSVGDYSSNITFQDFLVIVQDTTPPTFDFISDQVIEIGTFTDVDWTFFITNAEDNYSDVLIFGEIDGVDYQTVGIYPATVTVTDADGNTASETINVSIVNTEPPTFDFIYDQTIEVNTYSSIDWTVYILNAADNAPGELIKEVYYDGVIYNQVGVYSVEVRLYDAAMNMTSQTFTVNVVDTQLPVINLIGDSIIYVEINTPYVELGALVTDNYDDSLEVVINNYVDTSIFGSFVVTYNVTDSSGNTAFQVIRDVIVVDTTNPSFTPINDQVIEAGEYTNINWEEFIVDATDNSNHGTFIYEEVDEVDYDRPGEYLVAVRVSDHYGNSVLNEFYVTIIDTTKPEFDVISEFSIDEDLYQTYNWLNLVSEVTDNSDLPVYLYIASDTVNYYEPGVYIVTIVAYDSAYNFNSKTIEVTVIDTTPPIFDAIGPQTIEVGEFTEFDWTDLITNAEDNFSKVIYFEEVYDGVNYGETGEYDVQVRVTDDAGNYDTMSFTVTVVDTTMPWFDEIADQTIEIGNFSNIDWTSLISGLSDNSNRPVTVLEVNDAVIYDILGTYQVTVSASDETGNTRERTFFVTVIDTVKPLVSLNPSIDSIPRGSNYTEYGVEVFDYTNTVLYISGSVNTNVAGTYVLTYVVIDEGNNISTKQRIVTVYDSVLQVRFILGDAVTTINVDDNFVDGSCTVLIGDLELACTVKENTVNNQIPGIYTITYTYTYLDIEYSYKRYVFVIDEDEPLILYSPFRKEEGEEI